ncbi:MAG TPA: hypothetical protein VNL91_09615 [Thermoanaerobaculia bacterium]|nr:hypothetical protein [Thermoanaerobaculia bacterium]
MRRVPLLFVLFLAVGPALLAKDVYLSIGGSVGVFRTDMRIFNPSQTKDIQVQAWLLRTGNSDNSAVQPKTITVPKRQMAIYDDVLTSLFNESGLGAIRLRSDDEFVATQRIYAVASNGTLGQFVPGLDVTAAKKNGVLIQLKSNATFRTNIGAVNPNNVPATVTWRLYDKNNALVATGSPVTMPPFAVIGPTNMASTFFFNPGTADLSDSWVGFTSAISRCSPMRRSSTTEPPTRPSSRCRKIRTRRPLPLPPRRTSRSGSRTESSASLRRESASATASCCSSRRARGRTASS